MTSLRLQIVFLGHPTPYNLFVFQLTSKTTSTYPPHTRGNHIPRPPNHPFVIPQKFSHHVSSAKMYAHHPGGAAPLSALTKKRMNEMLNFDAHKRDGQHAATTAGMSEVPFPSVSSEHPRPRRKRVRNMVWAEDFGFIVELCERSAITRTPPLNPDLFQLPWNVSRRGAIVCVLALYRLLDTGALESTHPAWNCRAFCRRASWFMAIQKNLSGPVPQAVNTGEPLTRRRVGPRQGPRPTRTTRKDPGLKRPGDDGSDGAGPHATSTTSSANTAQRPQEQVATPALPRPAGRLYQDRGSLVHHPMLRNRRDLARGDPLVTQMPRYHTTTESQSQFQGLPRIFAGLDSTGDHFTGFLGDMKGLEDYVGKENTEGIRRMIEGNQGFNGCGGTSTLRTRKLEVVGVGWPGRMSKGRGY